MQPNQPVALTIAGSDCSSGAGIQADLKTFHSYEVFGLTAVTGVVAESPHEVTSWQALSPSLLHDQLGCLLENYPIAAIKTGALFSGDLAKTVAKILSSYKAPLIVDPVGTSSTGTSLGGTELLSSLETFLLPQATLITPNLKEAQLLSGLKSTDLTELALCLAQKYNTSILVKGGHLSEEIATDILVTPSLTITEFSLPRIKVQDHHGTGCTLSAAITSEVALGKPLEEAIYGGKNYLHKAISSAHHWKNVSALNTFRNS